jgi:hypothetical protein
VLDNRPGVSGGGSQVVSHARHTAWLSTTLIAATAAAVISR